MSLTDRSVPALVDSRYTRMESSSEDEAARKEVKPVPTEAMVVTIVREHFACGDDVHVAVKLLESYDDANFLVTTTTTATATATTTTTKYLLKFYNGIESMGGIVEGYSCLLGYTRTHMYTDPLTHPSLTSSTISPSQAHRAAGAYSGRVCPRCVGVAAVGHRACASVSYPGRHQH